MTTLQLPRCRLTFGVLSPATHLFVRLLSQRLPPFDGWASFLLDVSESPRGNRPGVDCLHCRLRRVIRQGVPCRARRRAGRGRESAQPHGKRPAPDRSLREGAPFADPSEKISLELYLILFVKFNFKKVNFLVKPILCTFTAC